MTRRRVIALALSGSILLAVLVSCGRYGRPVRSDPQPEPQEHAQTAEKR